MQISGYSLTKNSVTLFTDQGMKIINKPTKELIDILSNSHQEFLQGNIIDYDLPMEYGEIIFKQGAWEIDSSKGIWMLDSVDISNLKNYIQYYYENNGMHLLEDTVKKIAASLSTSNLQGILNFLDKNIFPITKSGKLLFMRKVGINQSGTLVDINTGKIPQSVGNVIEILRELVDADSTVSCSKGLHVCTPGYLRHFGTGHDNYTIVAVNPEDFVALASEKNKSRVCRFQVVKHLPKEIGDQIANLDYSSKELAKICEELVNESAEGFKAKRIITDKFADASALVYTVPSPCSFKKDETSNTPHKVIPNIVEQLAKKSEKAIKEKKESLRSKVALLVKKCENTKTGKAKRISFALELLQIKKVQKQGWKTLGLTQNQINLVEKLIEQSKQP